MKRQVKEWAFCCFVLVTTLISLSVNAESKAQVYQEVFIDSKVLKQQRRVLVSLPQNYDIKKDLSFPVMYLLDGDSNLSHTSGSARFLANIDMAPEMIIVAISNINRFYDYTPTVERSGEGGRPTGGGEQFLDFIAQELMPHINKNFRTVDYSIFTGHSLGGLMVVHAMATRPQLFDAYFAYSPSLWFDEEKSLDLAIETLQRPNLPLYLYVSLGDEKGPMRTAFERFDKSLQQAKPSGFRFNIERLPQESHFSIPLQSQINAYKALFPNWRLPREMFDKDVEAIKDFYATKTKQFGFEVLPSESAINSIGYYQLQAKDNPDAAIEMFQLNVENYPQSSNTYHSLAEAFEQKGKLKKALKLVDKAIIIGGKSDPNYYVYVEHKEALAKRIED